MAMSDFKRVKGASAVIVFTFVTKPFLFYLDCFYSNIHSFPEKFFYRLFLQRGNHINAVEAADKFRSTHLPGSLMTPPMSHVAFSV